MNSIQRIEHWGDMHHPKWLDIVRIGLGIFIFIKGVEFARNSGTVISLLQDDMRFNAFLVVLLKHFVIFGLLAGGFGIATGLFTRLSCILLMPIVLGALIFAGYSLFRPLSELWLALLVLLMLIFFFIEGSGSFSLDRFIERENETQR